MVFLTAVGLAAAGCARVSQEAQQHRLQIDLEEPIFPPAVGQDTLTLNVTDANGAPINDAVVAVKGDMTHAGMMPVLAEVTGGDNGRYQVPFTWTMGGDWVLTVQVTLPDGTVAEETFSRTVAGDSADCETEPTETP